MTNANVFSLQVLTPTPPAAARTCSVVSEPAVAPESDPCQLVSKRTKKQRKSLLLTLALYPGNTICCILCHFKMFLDETVMLLLLFVYMLSGNNPQKREILTG